MLGLKDLFASDCAPGFIVAASHVLTLQHFAIAREYLESMEALCLDVPDLGNWLGRNASCPWVSDDA